MTMTSYPKVGGITTDAQYAELFSAFVGTGVRTRDDLTPSADSSGLKVTVSSGFAVVAGCAFKSTETESLDVETNSSSRTRVDTIVLRRDYSGGDTVTLAIVTGTPSAAPSAPSLTQDVTGVYEEPLADVRVASSAATITSSNVTDRREIIPVAVGEWTTATRPAGLRSAIGYNRSTRAYEAFRDGSWTTLLDSSVIAVQSSAPSDPAPGTIHIW